MWFEKASLAQLPKILIDLFPSVGLIAGHWAAAKEFALNYHYHSPETILFTMYPYCGSLSSLTATQDNRSASRQSKKNFSPKASSKRQRYRRPPKTGFESAIVDPTRRRLFGQSLNLHVLDP